MKAKVISTEEVMDLSERENTEIIYDGVQIIVFTFKDEDNNNYLIFNNPFGENLKVEL